MMKVALHCTTGKKFLIKDLNDHFHTQYGILRHEDLESSNAKIRSSKGEEFIMFEPTFADVWEQFVRGPQLMIPKDIGLIIAKTGLGKDYIVVDAGGGTGSLCFSLANLCRFVSVYESNPEHYHILMKNKELSRLQNVNIKQEDVTSGIEERDIDLITLDLPEPWNVVNHAGKALKLGGFLVVYLPNLTQVKQFYDAVKGTNFRILETVELMERKWKIEEKIMRPEFEMLGHTGFLTFCRRF